MLSEQKTVLFVEDNPDDRFLFERAWRGAGIRHPLRTLASGEAALEYLRGTGPYADRAAHPLPAFVLLDIKMPGLSGFQVLSSLRQDERFRELPVLMLTASTARSDVLEAYRRGANGFFIKPSTVQELVKLLQSLRDCWLEHNEFPEL